MGAILAALEHEGLTERAAHSTDCRRHLFRLTAAGEEARKRRRPLTRSWLAHALAELGRQETVQLRAALEVLRQLGEQEPQT